MNIINYILIFVFGVLMGNFTTTLLHRLPRGIMLHGFDKKNTRPPFCSSCEHLLKFYEYLPILSWVSTRGSCNYCDAKITPAYFYLEILGGFFAVICALLYGGDIENYLLHFLFYILAALSFFISKEHSSLPKELILGMLTLGALQRTLNEQSIIPWLVSLCFAAIISLYILKDNVRKRKSQQLVAIILLASMWCVFPYLAIFAAATLVFLPFRINFYRKNIVLLVAIVMSQSVWQLV